MSRTERTALYRHFDAEGRLLYVGITNHSLRRLSQHSVHARWYEAITRVEIQWLESRAAALTAEAIAIARENPLWNVRRPGQKEPVEVIEQPLPAWGNNEVAMTGEPLHYEYGRGVQWSVTKYGIEARCGHYALDVEALADRHLVEHVCAKSWVNAADFCLAYDLALDLHRVKRATSAVGAACVVHLDTGLFSVFCPTRKDADRLSSRFAGLFPSERFGVWAPPVDVFNALRRTQWSRDPLLSLDCPDRFVGRICDDYRGPRARLQEAVR